MPKIPFFETDRFSAIAIGSSTGGPGVVQGILSGLPADLPAPIFLAQHMPPNFTASFAHSLANSCALNVIHAEDGMPVLAGTVYVGVGHQHMRVRRVTARRQVLEIDPEPERLLFKPAADEIFRTCAEVYGGRTLAVVISGIGHDGTDGGRRVHEAGGVILTQHETTCAVYGMPRSCVEAGISAAQLTPEQIRLALLQLSPQHAGEARA